MEKVNLNYLDNLIDKRILNKLKVNYKINELFPVQKVIIPLLLNQLKKSNLSKPHDLCIASPTGSGKTLTFALPIIQHLTKFVNKRNLRVLIILPTTDLASQVLKVFQDLCNDLFIHVASAIGNRPFSVDLSTIFDKKDNKLINRADILIATPGKLIDLITKVPEFSLKSLEILIIDEVDRILNSELEHEWISSIESSIYSKKIDCNCLLKENDKFKYSQFNGCCLATYSSSRNVMKLLFSATLTNDKSKLDNLNLFEPLFFNFSSETKLNKLTNCRFELPKTLNQHFINVPTDYKPAMIIFLMREFKYRKIICFVGKTENVHRLNLLLNNFKEFNIVELSSQISSERREKLKTDFSLGKIDLIICTDIMARGIDLQDVNCVINYEPPHSVEAYVHRVGRTARGNKSGRAITFIDKLEKQRFSIIARKTVGNRNISNHKLSYDNKKFRQLCDQYTKMLDNLKDDVNKEEKQKKKHRFKLVNNLK